MTGRLLGIARRSRARAPMEVLGAAQLGLTTGVAGDTRGRIAPGRSSKRQVTVLAREDWDAAIAALGVADPGWTTRRANLLVEGIVLPRGTGDRIAIGDSVLLEVTGECAPCQRMDAALPGLQDMLALEWRGGVIARVVAGGDIAIDDEVRIETL